MESLAERIEGWSGPLPGAKEARAIGMMALAVGAILCALSLAYGFREETFMGRPLGSDFVEFYAAGKLVNEGRAAQMYDLATIVGLEHRTLPTMATTQMLVFGNAPYVTLLFSPLARLPYAWAYCVWLAISMGLFTAALVILFRATLPAGSFWTAFLMALSSPMFLLETWIGGQISVLAFFAVALLVRCLRDRRWFLAGVSLSLAAYKPSLLAVPAAMLVVGACWQTLAGLIAGSAVWGALSVATAGVEGMSRWVATLGFFRALVANGVIRRVKYVDFNSFFAMLAGGNTIARAAANVCATAAIAGALFLLARAWWKSRNEQDRGLLWAATIALTLVVNVYVPVYDTIILIAALALTAQALDASSNEDRRRQFKLWLVALYLAPWVTQSFAEFARVQILTILLAGFGAWALYIRRPDCERRGRFLL